MTEKVAASLTVSGLCFYDAPSNIEGSPYWVDLWASVNGYRIGLQIKPKTFRSASLSIYTGKGRKSQEGGHRKFEKQFGGKVVTAVPTAGVLDTAAEYLVAQEVKRLSELPAGPHVALP